MKGDTEVKISTQSNDLLITVDKSLSTLESNFYINRVCIAYSKLISLEKFCSIFLNWGNVSCTIEDYLNILQDMTPLDYGENTHIKWHQENLHNWFRMDRSKDAKVFFRLFDLFDMPLIHIDGTYSTNISGVGFGGKSKVSFGIFKSPNLLHDFKDEALKVMLIKHFSPPEYYVNAIEKLLELLITGKRTEELHKVDMCLKRQEYLYKDIKLTKEIASVSKFLQDENTDIRIKEYLLSSLYTILDEQEKLHKKMDIVPSIKHIDFSI